MNSFQLGILNSIEKAAVVNIDFWMQRYLALQAAFMNGLLSHTEDLIKTALKCLQDSSVGDGNSTFFLTLGIVYSLRSNPIRSMMSEVSRCKMNECDWRFHEVYCGLQIDLDISYFNFLVTIRFEAKGVWGGHL
jgi:hypothetical protein